MQEAPQHDAHVTRTETYRERQAAMRSFYAAQAAHADMWRQRMDANASAPSGRPRHLR